MIGCRSLVAPFASLDGTLGPIAIGDDTNVQDNVVLSGKLVVLGDHVSIAHGATIIGPATIGAPKGLPAFVGFNSVIDGATVEPDAMVTQSGEGVSRHHHSLGHEGASRQVDSNAGAGRQ